MDNILAPRFIDPVAARKHLEALRWPDGAECPHCSLINATAVKGGREGLYQCNSCREQFTVTVGTVFERSKVPLNKWLLCNHLLMSSKKGMSAHQIHRMLGVTYKTAWFMCHRLREAMKPVNPEPLGGPGKTVEADETFVGGKARNRAFGKPSKKQMVMTLVERDGKARSFHIANIHAHTIRSALVTSVDRASRLMSDDHVAYKTVGKEFAGGHFPVIHSAREYAFMDMHSNTAENFFSILKRGVIGTYHHWSAAHIHRYLAEFDFRYSTKDISDRERADLSLKGIAGKRLTYRRTNRLAA
ncbi:MAG: IS1595 family transposase [Sphingomicrobium sp.]